MLIFKWKSHRVRVHVIITEDCFEHIMKTMNNSKISDLIPCITNAITFFIKQIILESFVYT